MTEQKRPSFFESLSVLGGLSEMLRISRVKNHPHNPGCTKSKDIVVDAEEYVYADDPRLSGFYAYKETHCDECGAVEIIDPYDRKGKQDRKKQ